MNGTNFGGSVVYTGTTIEGYTQKVSSYDISEPPPAACMASQTRIETNSHTAEFTCSDAPIGATSFTKPYQYIRNITYQTFGGSPCKRGTQQQTVVRDRIMFYSLKWSDVVECPVEHPLGPEGVFDDLGNLLDTYCYRIPVDEPPEECDDIVGNCEPDPECVEGGNGIIVCNANPDDKCDKEIVNEEPVYSNCEAGCGFIMDKFMCPTEPDGVPNFEKCEITQTGYVCPNEPDDNITDPDKPLPDMKKQDFKDVNVGIETRQDKTNDLIETLIASGKSDSEAQIKADAENTEKINAGQGKSNDYLKQIDLNTKKLADALAPEETREIGEPESWYEPVYEDGIAGVWDEHKAIIMQAPIFEFIDQFSLAPSGSQPDWTFNLNLGAMGSYGTHRLEVPAFVWNFIRICMLLGASFTARRLIFGG